MDAPTLHALLTELERSIRRSADGGRLPAFPPVAGYAGRFLPAHDVYLWTRGCNWWTVARLAGAGLAGDPRGVVFTPQVPGRLRGFVRVPRASS